MTAFNSRAKGLGWAFTCGLARDFEHAELTAAHAVWRDKAAGRTMPCRADLTARSMKPFLTHMSLLERVAAGGTPRYRVRLHGSTLARYSGDSTGKFLEDCISPERIESFIALYDTAMAMRTPLRVVSHYQAPEIDYLMGESLLAPLAMPVGDTPMLLSVTYAKPRADFSRTPVIANRN
ncbi:MAG TPA: PAS domain-containing protein [Rhizomicrobium sp.]|nr:PAS domain-containing protein [Rhizomicrobium sp.]